MTIGLSAINPYMSGIGGYSGMYGDPAMMMYGGMNGMGGAYTGMGMMMDPSYINYYNQIQQNMEKSQVTHADDMHKRLMESKVNQQSAHTDMIVQTLAQDGGVQASIASLNEAIKSGNSNAIKQKYDELKQDIITRHNGYFKQNSVNMNLKHTIRGVIDGLYQQIVSAQTGETVTLVNDLRRYGESAAGYGFNKGLYGSKDYHDNYTEEVLNYIYETGIDNKAGKDKMKRIGERTGKAVKWGAAPIGLGATGAAIGSIGGKWGALAGGVIGTGIGIIGDFLWSIA